MVVWMLQRRLLIQVLRFVYGNIQKVACKRQLGLTEMPPVIVRKSSSQRRIKIVNRSKRRMWAPRYWLNQTKGSCRRCNDTRGVKAGIRVSFTHTK